MGVKPNSTGDGSRRAADEGIDRCRPRKESPDPARDRETGGRWLSGRITAVRMKPGRERRRRTRRSRPVAARTKSGALPRCCGQAHAHLAKLISRSHAGRRRPREGSRSALFDFSGPLRRGGPPAGTTAERTPARIPRARLPGRIPGHPVRNIPDAHGTEQVCASQSRTACNPCRFSYRLDWVMS